MEENTISGIVLDCCVRIHRHLGPGLLESVYEQLLAYELSKAGLRFERQLRVPVEYDGQIIDLGFRADMIVESRVVLELKSVEAIHPVHKMQVLTYLKLTRLKLGLLINFNVDLLKNGYCRIVNNL